MYLGALLVLFVATAGESTACARAHIEIVPSRLLRLLRYVHALMMLFGCCCL